MALRVIRPIGDRIIVIPEEQTEITEGGLHIPTGAKLDDTCRGTVKAVGPGRYDINGKIVPMSVEEGDIVIYPAGAGTEVKLSRGGGKVTKFTMLSEEDIFVVDRDATEEELLAIAKKEELLARAEEELKKGEDAA